VEKWAKNYEEVSEMILFAPIFLLCMLSQLGIFIKTFHSSTAAWNFQLLPRSVYSGVMLVFHLTHPSPQFRLFKETHFPLWVHTKKESFFPLEFLSVFMFHSLFSALEIFMRSKKFLLKIRLDAVAAMLR
jgi:hypothetical protein